LSDERSAGPTFASLDREQGIAELPAATEGGEYPLPAWYRAVRDTPIEKLALEDIAKATRQQIHLEHVVPVALRLLEVDPAAGHMYDGELIASLVPVPVEYWLQHAGEAQSLRLSIERARQYGIQDLEKDLNALVRKVASSR
jgi:CDI immunity proteins